MKQRWKVLLVTSVAVFMGFLDVTIVNIAFPDIEASFSDTSLAGLSWILNAYNIVFAALLVPAGRLSDRLGRRRMFFVGIWTFLAASTVCGLAPSVEVLVAARVVQAAGAAILVPTSLALLLPEFPLEQRATATALWGATGGIAAATGPALGGVLVEATSWRWVFFVNLAIGLPALIPARRLLRESRDPNPGPLTDILGIVLLVAGVGLLSLGIVKGQDWGWGSAAVVGSLAAAALALAAFVARSARHPAPVIELGLLRVRSFAVANAGVFLFALGFYAVLLANILFLTGVWGWSVLRAGIAVTPGPLDGRALGHRRRAAGRPLRPARGRSSRRAALRRGLPRLRRRHRRHAALRQRVPARDAPHRHRRRPQLRCVGQRRRRRAATVALRDRQRHLRHLAPDRRGARHRRPRRGHRHPAPRGRHVHLPHRLGAHGHPVGRRGLLALALGRVRARNPEAAVALAAAEA
jgi:MFS family permease